jgi:hypothetical protein
MMAVGSFVAAEVAEVEAALKLDMAVRHAG